jgi:hypothetical protein
MAITVGVATLVTRIPLDGNKWMETGYDTIGATDAGTEHYFQSPTLSHVDTVILAAGMTNAGARTITTARENHNGTAAAEGYVYFVTSGATTAADIVKYIAIGDD